MTPVFLDAYALIGWINARDQAHEEVMDYLALYKGKIVTTEWIFVEAADALCAPAIRGATAGMIRRIRRDPQFVVVPYDPAVYDRGFDLFAARPDKEWSLTDCVSFAVMTQRKLTDALTADRHFTQAGFRAVFAP